MTSLQLLQQQSTVSGHSERAVVRNQSVFIPAALHWCSRMQQDCLIVIDMLNDYLDQRDPGITVRLVVKINELIAAFRTAALHVIWIRQAFRPDLSDAFLEMRDKHIAVTIDGTRGAEIHTELSRPASDPVITKRRNSAFFRTDLDELLDSLGVTHVTLAGLNTHACIRTAAIDAYQRDLRVPITSECIDSLDGEHARISLDYMRDRIAALSDNHTIITSLRHA